MTVSIPFYKGMPFTSYSRRVVLAEVAGYMTCAAFQGSSA